MQQTSNNIVNIQAIIAKYYLEDNLMLDLKNLRVTDFDLSLKKNSGI